MALSLVIDLTTSNTEKKPLTNLQYLYKNLSKEIKSDNLMGRNREKTNIAISIFEK
jgi:hypothetical protein